MDFEIDIDRSSSSSPDPLGQPDLSSPLRTTPRERSHSRRRSSRRHEILRTPTPASRNASRSASRTNTPAVAAADDMLAQRISPRPSFELQQYDGATAEEEGPIDMAGGGYSDSDGPDSPSQSFLGEATTTTVPIKSGDETPKRGKKRPATPRRKGTPAAQRTRSMFPVDTSPNGEEQRASPSPTPKRSPGRPRKSPRKVNGEDLLGPPLNPRVRLSAPEDSIPLPGASPGKRRRVVSDGPDEFRYSYTMADRVKVKALRNGPASPPSSSRPVRSTTPPFVTRRGTGSSASPHVTSTNAIATSAQVRRSPRQQIASHTIEEPEDPTDDHDEFDSILESEDFTRVSLSNIPSGQYLRSLTGGALANSTATNATEPQSTSKTSPDRNKATRANQGADTVRQPDASLNDEPSRAGEGLLAGFGAGTKRAMRDALRLGDRLAKQQVEAKKAAAHTEEVTANVWAELAEEEASGASNTAEPLLNNVHALANNHAVSAFPQVSPEDVSYPQLPQQQPTPEQSDDQVVEPGNDMSWRYDTPAKAQLGLQRNPPSNSRVLPTTAKTPPVPAWTSSPARSHKSGQGQEVCLDSSPDKQLFLEQAAYEMQAAETRRQQHRPLFRHIDLAIEKENDELDDELDEDDDKYRDDEYEEEDEEEEEVIMINSGEVGSDLDSDTEMSEEAPVISDATKSILEDDETDIWANEAQASLDESGLQQKPLQEPRQARQPASSPTQIVSPLTMRGALPEPAKEKSPQLPELEKELYEPRRGKLLSAWRRQDSSPVVYSDEPELPPAEDVRKLKASQGLKRKFITPPDARTKHNYNEADYSILSEFKNVAAKKSPPGGDAPASSPTKRVRFESEDPEHPYYPTTPLHATVESVDDEEADEGEGCGPVGQIDDDSEDDESEEEERPTKKIKRTGSAKITWEDKTPTPPRKGSWLSGLLPSWFSAPKEPVFSFSFPRFATKLMQPEQYEPTMPDGEFTVEDHHSLVRLYDHAKIKSLRPAESEDVMCLEGREIESHGWRKRINAWELSIVEEFLQDDYNDQRFKPEDIAIRLFGIWATDVQEGRTGLGNGTAGIFSSAYVANRKAVLAKAKRLKSMAAS